MRWAGSFNVEQIAILSDYPPATCRYNSIDQCFSKKCQNPIGNLESISTQTWQRCYSDSFDRRITRGPKEDGGLFEPVLMIPSSGRKKVLLLQVCQVNNLHFFLFLIIFVHLFTAELMVDKAMELRYIGGIFGGNIKPTPFICLTLKMLQIQPDKDIIVEFIKNEDFK